MTQIPVINRSNASDFDVAYWVEGCDQQARHVAAVWQVEYTPVVFYSKAEGLPPLGECRILTIESSLDVDGALAYHDVILGDIYAKVLALGDMTPTLMSHEIIEEMIDPWCNLWDPFTDGREQAREGCDRVEGDTYLVNATIMGRTEQVPVSNWLLPSAFMPGSIGPWDKMGRLTSWSGMTVGGYAVVRDKRTGEVDNIYARRRTAPRVAYPPSARAESHLATKLAKPGGRLVTRLRS